MSEPCLFYKSSNDDSVFCGREIWNVKKDWTEKNEAMLLKPAEPYFDLIEAGKRMVVIHNTSNLSSEMFRECVVFHLSTKKDTSIDKVLEIPPEKKKKHFSLLYTLFPDGKTLFKSIRNLAELNDEMLMRMGIAGCLSRDEDLQHSGMLKLSSVYERLKRPCNLIILRVRNETNPRVYASYHTYGELRVIQ